jgi:hypothetical protein
MPDRTEESPRPQDDPDMRSGLPAVDEPRNFGHDSQAMATQPQSAHPGFDADLNPIDDDLINTHGSER